MRKAGKLGDLEAEARGEMKPASPSTLPSIPAVLPRGFVQWEGRTVRLFDLCVEHGVVYNTVRHRLGSGIPLADALRSRSALVGRRFGRLVVLECTIGGDRVAVCHCDCGAVKSVRVNYLQRRLEQGATCSCGCYHLEKISGGLAPTHVEVFGKRLSMGELGVLADLRPASIWAKMRRGMTAEEAAFGNGTTGRGKAAA
jgi:hypothetical protein